MEQKIRRNWLLSFILITLVTNLYLTIFSQSLYTLAPMILITALGAMTYYFGYKKKASKWLSAVIIVRALSIVLSSLQIAYLFFSKQMTSFIYQSSILLESTPTIFTFIWVSGIALNIYYWFNCYRLRKINILIKEQGIL